MERPVEEIVMFEDVVDRLDSLRIEIAIRYEQRLKQHVRAYEPLSSADLAATAAGLIGMFVRLLRERASAPRGFDMRLLRELEAVSRERARQGVRVGDLYTAFAILQATGREIVFEHTPDSELRLVSRAWVDVEVMTALVLAWILDEHSDRLKMDAT